jgi:hypothetical protein
MGFASVKQEDEGQRVQQVRLEDSRMIGGQQHAEVKEGQDTDRLKRSHEAGALPYSSRKRIAIPESVVVVQ